MAEKITVSVLREKKAQGLKITMVTAYDYPSARMVEEAGLDMILVGDSLGNAVLGYETLAGDHGRNGASHQAVCREPAILLLWRICPSFPITFRWSRPS